MPQIKITKNTVIKHKPIQSSQLSAPHKFPGKVGDTFEVEGYALERSNHYRVIFKEPIGGNKVFYVYLEHCEIIDGSKVITPAIQPTKYPILLPYKSQRDNLWNPSGACNVTSFAMCLEYIKAPRKTSEGQFEDELYLYCEDNGLDRHSPYDLARMARAYGVKSEFTDKGSISGAKNALNGGHPCIVHGFFTDYGHIIALAGFNSTGFICCDPWGYLDQYDSYNNERSGRFYTMPYHQFTRLAMPDGYLWLHVLTKM